jgi:hypothetical protein
MMKTIAEQVEAWYRENVGNHAVKFTKMTVGSNQPADPTQGSAGIELETPVFVASITFWNKGDVTVLGLHKESKKDFIFDDRVLRPGEQIPALLDRYFRQITEQCSRGE